MSILCHVVAIFFPNDATMQTIDIVSVVPCFIRYINFVFTKRIVCMRLRCLHWHCATTTASIGDRRMQMMRWWIMWLMMLKQYIWFGCKSRVVVLDECSGHLTCEIYGATYFIISIVYFVALLVDNAYGWCCCDREKDKTTKSNEWEWEPNIERAKIQIGKINSRDYKTKIDCQCIGRGALYVSIRCTGHAILLNVCCNDVPPANSGSHICRSHQYIRLNHLREHKPQLEQR